MAPLLILFFGLTKLSPCVLHTILIVLCLVTGIFAKEKVDPSEYKHRGDLHFQRGSSIYSLAWVVEIKKECSIKDVIGSKSKKYMSSNYSDQALYASNTRTDSKIDLTNFIRTVNEYLFKNKRHSCTTDMPTHLILLKKIDGFDNTYIIAHPYFKVFSIEKRKFNQRKKRNRQHNLDSQNKTKDVHILDKYENADSVFLFIEKCLSEYFDEHPCVNYAKQEILRSRRKRGLEFHDPLYHQQWHLKTVVSGQFDINVVGAWESGITGRGVTVCVIDDGLEWQHPDLRDNYNAAGSYDLNSDDPDPSPVKNGERNEHGTRCAGEIAAVANDVCGVGVAYRANISGIRVLGGRMTDSMEAAAFVRGLEVNDIYSCSWGPDDDGKTVDGPHHLASQALIHGVTYGRKGYGSIYVVASGNGGRNKDNCNFDGYANSIYTITIGAVDFMGQMPYYAEECAAMLAVTPSSDSNGRDIVTTDWRELSSTGCTRHHSGTSAAAPLAAGVIALALEVQPCLSWRDVQHLIALTSRKIDVENSDWSTNGAGLHHSHQHGFGLIDASAMVSAATVWESVPFSTSYSSYRMKVNLEIPRDELEQVKTTLNITQDMITGYALESLEYVQVRVTIEHEYRGSLRIILICPSGTKSMLAAPREKDNSTEGLNDWPLGTVRCWGESPLGLYELQVIHKTYRAFKGKLLSWQLVLHGSSMTPNMLQERRELVKRAVRGEFVHVNRSKLCHPPELRYVPFAPFPDRWLKILTFMGTFFILMTIFNTLEYIFCYNDEKKKFYQKLKDVSQGRALTQRNASVRRVNSGDTNPFGSFESGVLSQGTVETTVASSNSNEILPLMLIERGVSPSMSCDADISSLYGDSDDDILSSRCTSDTVVPKDTDVTDFTNDEFQSEVDEDRRTSEIVNIDENR